MTIKTFGRKNMSAIGIIATLRVQPGKEEEFEAVFAELAPAVRANEPGNSYYKLFRTSEAGVYKVLECYDDDAAVDAHRASDHFRTIGARLGPCLAGAPEIEKLPAV
jgi:quinol monooxygenase YgiN